jgi:hypothetical protein
VYIYIYHIKIKRLLSRFTSSYRTTFPIVQSTFIIMLSKMLYIKTLFVINKSSFNLFIPTKRFSGKEIIGPEESKKKK